MAHRRGPARSIRLTPIRLVGNDVLRRAYQLEPPPRGISPDQACLCDWQIIALLVSFHCVTTNNQRPDIDAVDWPDLSHLHHIIRRILADELRESWIPVRYVYEVVVGGVAQAVWQPASTQKCDDTGPTFPGFHLVPTQRPIVAGTYASVVR